MNEKETNVPQDVEVKEKELIEQVRDMKENMVSKDDYVKLMKENKELVNELLNNRQVITDDQKKELTNEDIINRCKERTNSLTGDNSLSAITALCENYDDMVTLGMDVSNIDANIVGSLKQLVEQADGDKTYFDALMQKHVNIK